MSEYFKERIRIFEETGLLTVTDQYDLAKKLAANCGYKLVAEDDERSLQIKQIIDKINRNDPIVYS